MTTYRGIRDLRYLNRVYRELGSYERQQGSRSIFYDRDARPLTREAYMHVGIDRVDNRVATSAFGGVRVSTIYLGIDHNHGAWITGHSRPLIYETKVFAGERVAEIRGLDLEWRYTYEREARLGHKYACHLVAWRLKQYTPETIATIAAAEDARMDALREQTRGYAQELIAAADQANRTNQANQARRPTTDDN